MPAITAFARVPALKLVSCLSKYSGCCPANLGFKVITLLPSAPWQAEHTALTVASAPITCGAGAASGTLDFSTLVSAGSSFATFSAANVGKTTRFNANINAETRRITTPNNSRKIYVIQLIKRAFYQKWSLHDRMFIVYRKTPP